ncbi:MAG TPA: aminotransferase class IV [Vicinamibacterales bacterium]|nr:aminotransferase class IV [Vicinamibacterales bacterium]
MSAVVYVNGKIADAEHASVPVFDHGFLYGEGVYETLRTYQRRPFLFDRHMRRLRQSASLMALDVPFSDAELHARIDETVAAHPELASHLGQGSGGQDAEAYIRVLLTRGVGELTYNPAATPKPSLVIIVKPFPVPPERTFSQGIKLALVSVRRNHPQALNPMIKSNNLINNALAMQEALRQGAEEALMQNQAGELVECSQSNFFVVRDGRVLTPPLSAGLLPGITRELVLELAAELGISGGESRLTPADLERVQEAFITGTTREVTPVIAVSDQTIGDGKPGEMTKRLLAAFRKRT